MNKKPLNICWDIDDTIWKVRLRETESGHKVGDQVPDYDLIQVLRWFYNNGDNCFIWSAGGTEYAYKIAEKLGLDEMVTIIAKPPLDGNDPRIDISFDDCEVNLAKVSVLVNRPDYNK